MVAISVHADVAKAVKGLGAFASKQVPFATALALNDVAFQVRTSETAAIRQVLTSPRPFTAKSVQVNKAAKASLVAQVFIRPEVARYLDPFEFGGKHVLPGKALLNPVHQGVDAFGQLVKGTARRLAARPDVFVGTVNGHSGFWQRLSPAVARRTGERLRLLIAFGRDENVHKHLGFIERGSALVAKQMLPAMRRALVKALASAR